jgi:hypothetical protein
MSPSRIENNQSGLSQQAVVQDEQRRYLRVPSSNLTSEVEPSRSSPSVADANGKLGVMIPGMGAVATTFVAGVEAVRKGIALPIGSLTQVGTIRLGKRTEGRSPKIKEFLPLANLEDLVFAGWDIFEDDMYEAASKAKVLETSLLEKVKPCLQAIKPLSAVFDRHYVKRLNGHNVKKGRNKMELAQQVRSDIYEEYPELELSNNLAENSMRPVALGRKNWIHIGSQQAGPRVAAILSVVETCRRMNIPVRQYLAAVLPGLAETPIHRLPQLTPIAWASQSR